VSGFVSFFADGMGELDAAGLVALFDHRGRSGVCIWVFYLKICVFVVVVVLARRSLFFSLGVQLELCIAFFLGGCVCQCARAWGFHLLLLFFCAIITFFITSLVG
jgi:hypothetical protein